MIYLNITISSIDCLYKVLKHLTLICSLENRSSKRVNLESIVSDSTRRGSIFFVTYFVKYSMVPSSNFWHHRGKVIYVYQSFELCLNWTCLHNCTILEISSSKSTHYLDFLHLNTPRINLHSPFTRDVWFK